MDAMSSPARSVETHTVLTLLVLGCGVVLHARAAQGMGWFSNKKYSAFDL